MNKPNMAVEFCNVTFKNPIIAASGTVAFGKELDTYYNIESLGGISLKGTTLHPREGNLPPRIAETKSGMLNSVGLQNPGVDALINEELPFYEGRDVVTIANIAGETVEEYCEIARRLAGTHVDMIELNISCPNVAKGGAQFGVDPKSVLEVTQAVSAMCAQPLIVKLSPNTTDITQTALAAQQGGADAVSLINTLTGMVIDVHRRKPILGNIKGGLSGPAIMPVALRMVYEVAKAVTIPVIGMGGIMTGEDAIAFMLAGATAVQVGTANLVNPLACLTILQQIKDYMYSHEVEDIRTLIGALLD